MKTLIAIPGVPDSIDLRKFRDELKAQNFYANAVRGMLPKYVFKPVPQRLTWFFINYAIVIAGVFLIINFSEWGIQLISSILIGHSFGCLFFLGHEITHGTVIKNKKAILFFSSLCYLPWGLHGRAWIHAHNGKHHQHTQHSVKDPDCFGSKKYKRNKILQTLNNLLPGSGSWASYTFLFWFFSFYCIYIQWLHKPNIFTNKADEKTSKRFLLAVYAVWITIATFVTPFGFIYLFLIPLLISNAVVMSYISTNHFLNPLTEETNDPLVNSLSVKTNKFFNFLHLNFSYHVEHHVFPYVSPKYAPMIAKVLKEQFPNDYNEMGHAEALSLLYQRPKFYYNDVTLINPSTKKKYPTIVLEDVF